MADEEAQDHPRRPLVAALIVVAGVGLVIVLVAILGGPLLRGGDAPAASSVPSITLTYQVGVPAEPVAVSAVAGIMTERLNWTGALFDVSTADPALVVVQIAVPATEAKAFDDLLAPVGAVTIVPLGANAIEPGQAVPDIAPIVTDAQVAGASADADQAGTPALTIRLDADATAAFAAWSAGHVGEYLAIALDGRAIAVPVLLDTIDDGQIQVTLAGDSSPTEVSRLAAIIGGDPYPAPVARIGSAP